jgi:ribonuclease/clavin/mitogillin
MQAPESMEPVAPGVWRLALRTPTLPPATTTNTMVVVGRDVAVIEPATPDADERARLDAALAELEAAGKRVVAILLTHHHVDHVGYAEALAARHRAPILAHDQTALRVRFAVDRRLDDEERLVLGDGVVLRAVFTPGHAPGHLCYVEERANVAHVGDMVAGEGTILIDPHDGGDMAAYLASLQRVGALGLAAIVPAHGPVLRDPQAVVDHYVKHRLAREARIVEALWRGPIDMAALVAAAYADTPRALWPLAERSAEAHLRKLEDERRATRVGEFWRLRDRGD